MKIALALMILGIIAPLFALWYLSYGDNPKCLSILLSGVPGLSAAIGGAYLSHLSWKD